LLTWNTCTIGDEAQIQPHDAYVNANVSSTPTWLTYMRMSRERMARSWKHNRRTTICKRVRNYL